MKRKTILAVGATLALAATAMAQTNYAFPSPWNPAGLPANQITQLVMLSWDDNGYSGRSGTQYEQRAGTIPWDQSSFVGGMRPWGVAGAPNDLNIFEQGGAPGTMMGLNWAYRALARGGRLTNNGIPMVFNMITGLYINRASGEWDDSESFLGYLRPAGGEQAGGHRRIAVTWGREFRLPPLTQTLPGADGENSIFEVTRQLVAAGSEIGNHTIDHMESNSPLPGPHAQFDGTERRTFQVGGNTWSSGFGNWNNVGYAPNQQNVMSWGETIDEVQQFGQTSAGTPSNRGWLIFAGRQITEEAWRAYIQFSEVFLMHTDPQNRWSGLGLQRNQLQGFRAPRLEVNSALFYALKAANYTYDMGLEEGYEAHRTGHNYIWPYTFDNGVQNSWTQFSQGNRVFVDSTPDGLWQLSVSPIVVPQNIRQSVWSNHAEIMAGAGTPTRPADRDHWLTHGKVTGFDFNTWILYGMTGANWQTSMQHTLGLRINGNRAPMQFGMHTDYYTPIYDNATLRAPFNINGWGLPVVRNWNTWIMRQDETEKFVNHALSRNAQFVTGAQLVERMRQWVATGQGRARGVLPASQLPANWTYVAGTAGDVNQATSTTQNNLSGRVRISSTFVPDQPRYVLNFPAGTLRDATHIQLDYKQTSASMLRLITDSSGVIRAREVMLAHRHPIVSNDAPGNSPIDGTPDNGNFGRATLRNSGMIPISAFDYEPTVNYPMNYAPVNVSQIIAIEIQPLAPWATPIRHGQTGWSNQSRTETWEARFEFRNLRVHTGDPFSYPGLDTAITPTVIGQVNKNGARTLSIAGITNNTLNLSIEQAGTYNIGIYTVNGRQLQSFRGQTLAAGMQTLPLNNLARGVHIVRIQGVNNNQQLTRQVIVR